MNTTPPPAILQSPSPRQRCLMSAFLLVLALAAPAVIAAPYMTPVLDGRLNEYETTDLRGVCTAETWGDEGSISNLYVTWDAQALYIALQGRHVTANKLVLLLDADASATTGATTTTNWIQTGLSYIDYNDYGWVDASAGGFGADYMLASEGTYNNVIRILYDGSETPSTNDTEVLFDRGNGAAPAGTPIDMVCDLAVSPDRQKGIEFRIPWSDFYPPDGRFGTIPDGATVPTGAVIRLLVGVHNASPNDVWSSPDSIPAQPNGQYSNGILASTEYLSISIDTDSNGIPDGIDDDHAAPYLRAASGSVGGTLICAAFHKPPSIATAQNPANWSVNGVTPTAAVLQGTQVVQLTIPATTLTQTVPVPILVRGIADADGHTRDSSFYFTPATNGIPQPVTVTFLVCTNSGMGISTKNERPSAFFLNGGALPLEWGYPPFETTPLSPIPDSNGWATTTVTFPAGSPATLFYKYSARIQGTNTFEAIRLTDFTAAARQLALPADGTPLTVREYLGAAAHPLRDPANTNIAAHKLLYNDPNRGDAGVRARREILFQLDLSMRDHGRLSRVFVAGSDPLRGFNSNGESSSAASDFPGVYVSWSAAGLQLFDDGSHGDLTPNDGIYSRLWSFTTNGVDSAMEPTSPYSLVGGSRDTEPYLGIWKNMRSPRDIIYKFYAVVDENNHYESPSSNLSLYLANPDSSERLTLDPFLWDNEDLPPPAPTHPPVLTSIARSGSTTTVTLENGLSESSHGILVTTNLATAPFADYGTRAAILVRTNTIASWSATIPFASDLTESYAAYSGAREPFPTFWEPSLVSMNATTVRVHYSQFNGQFAGFRALSAAGNFNDWSETPMTFVSPGHWFCDLALPAIASPGGIQWKVRSGSTWMDGSNLSIPRADTVASWTPVAPVPGETFHILFHSAGTPLATASNIAVHLGFDATWHDTSARLMTGTPGGDWSYELTIPISCSQSVNWLFNGDINGTKTWYSPGGDWKAFTPSFTQNPYND